MRISCKSFWVMPITKNAPLERCPVTAEVASSSLVVPAIPFNRLQDAPSGHFLSILKTGPISRKVDRKLLACSRVRRHRVRWPERGRAIQIKPVVCRWSVVVRERPSTNDHRLSPPAERPGYAQFVED